LTESSGKIADEQFQAPRDFIVFEHFQLAWATIAPLAPRVNPFFPNNGDEPPIPLVVLAQFLINFVPRYLMEPSREAGVAAKPRQVGICLQRGHLNDLLGILDVSQDPKRKSPRRRQARLEQDLKSVGLTPKYARDNFSLFLSRTSALIELVKGLGPFVNAT
jgi:hypothetical protein